MDTAPCPLIHSLDRCSAPINVTPSITIIDNVSLHSHSHCRSILSFARPTIAVLHGRTPESIINKNDWNSTKFKGAEWMNVDGIFLHVPTIQVQVRLRPFDWAPILNNLCLSSSGALLLCCLPFKLKIDAPWFAWLVYMSYLGTKFNLHTLPFLFASDSGVKSIESVPH